jgi:hypothetical protein
MGKFRGQDLGDLGAANAAPTVTPQGTPGATAYSYVVVTTKEDGSVTRSAVGSTATGNATLSGTNFNLVEWAAIAGATKYEVYRTVGGDEQGKIATVTPGPGVDLECEDKDLTGTGTITSYSALCDVSSLEEWYGYVAGTFVGTWISEVSIDGTNWVTFDTHTAGKLSAAGPPMKYYRVKCATFTSGNIRCFVGGRDLDRSDL